MKPFHALASATRFALLVVLAIALSACGKKDPQQLLREGESYRAKGDTQAAIIEFKNALQINPSLRQARYALGLAYLDSGDGKSAEKELRKAIALGLENSDVKLALARALMTQGSWKELLAELKVAADVAPKTAANMHALRGHAQFSLNDLSAAREEYAKALVLMPNYAAALAGSARADLRENKLAEAQATANAAVKSAPNDAEAWTVKGDIARVKRDLPGATAAYLKALEHDPRNTLAKLNLVSVEIQQNKVDLAQKHLDELRKRLPDNPMLFYQQGLIDFQKKRYPEALAATQKVLQSVPGHVPTLLLQGAVQFLLGANEQAEQALKRVVAAAPGNLYARKLLAASLLKLKDPQRALNYVLPAIEVIPNDAQLLALAANAYMQLGESTKAANLMKSAVQYDPTSAALRTDLGLLQLASGDTASATLTLQQASGLDPTRTQADTILVVTQLRDKKYDDALATLARLEQRMPKDPSIHNMRGAAFLGKNDVAQARASFERALALSPTYMAAATNLAQLDLRAKNIPAARQRFESVLAKDKNNVAAMIALAQFEANTGSIAKSVDWLERARSVQPPTLEPRLILARLYLETRQPQKALAVAAEAQKLNPQQPDALDVLGSAQLATGDSANAFATFSQLVSAYPNAAIPHYRLGLAHMAKRDWTLGIAELNKAVELDPRILTAQTALSAAYLQTNDTAKALAVARGVRDKNPKLALGHILEGNVLLHQKKSAEALASYQKAFELAPSGQIVTKIFQARMQSGDHSGATSAMQEWLKSHPDDQPNRMVLADGFLQSKQYDLAVQQYQLVLKKDPAQAVALNNMAWSLQELNNPKALEFAEKALALQPNNGVIMDTVGWMLLKQNKTGRAVSLLEKAAAQRNDLPEIRYHLAVALAQSGDKLRARREIEAALASNIPFAQMAEAKAYLSQL